MTKGTSPRLDAALKTLGPKSEDAVRRASRSGPHSVPVRENPELTAMLKAAAEHVMTPEEKMLQRASYVFGQLPSSSKTTREEVAALVMQDFNAGVMAERKRNVDAIKAKSDWWSEVALTHPEDSENRARCWARARALAGICDALTDETLGSGPMDRSEPPQSTEGE